MKKALFIVAAFAFASCSSNSKSTKTSDSTATKSETAPKETVSKPATDWEYVTDTDKMTSKLRYFAKITATNRLQFESPYSGGSTGAITLRNKDNKSEVILTIDKGLFLGGEDHPINVRFDSDAPVQFDANEPSDMNSTTLFIDPSAKFIKRIKTAKKMIVQAEFYESGRQQMEFNVDGLKWEH